MSLPDCSHDLTRRVPDPLNPRRLLLACACGERVAATRVGALITDRRHVQILDPRREPYRRARRAIERAEGKAA